MWFALISVIIIALLLYKLLSPSDTKNYWAQYGIRQIDGSPAASQKEILTGVKDVTARDAYAYQQMGENEQFCGMIESSYKVIFVKDLELAKKILIKDFDHFVDRRNFLVVSKNSVLNKLLSSLIGQEWKNVRASISPAFTTGKIRRYMESFNSIGKNWVNMIKEKAEKITKTGSAININVLPTVTQFTTDVIAIGVFGFDAGTVRNPNSTFATMANRLGNMNQWKLALSLHFPKLFQFFNIDIIDMEAFRFFQKIVSQGLQARLSGDTGKRNDFLQMMVEVKKGELKAEGKDELSSFEKDAEIKTENKSNFVLTDDIINAQSVTFFFAGFSTTSNFLAFVLYSLAVYPDIQEKLRGEVRKMVKADGTFDYDDVGQLVYLDEVLRKFPAGLRVERMCTKDYKDPETNLFIPKGTLVVIPTKSIHNDKRYYEKPEEFYPEHFSPENKANRNPYAYLAFGSGPRNCIGMRLALVQSKAMIAHVLHNFRVEPTQTTKIPMEGKIGSLQILPPDDLELKFTVL